MGGSDKSDAPAAQQAAPQAFNNSTQEPTGACAWEIKQFLQCAQGQSDLSLCEGIGCFVDFHWFFVYLDFLFCRIQWSFTPMQGSASRICLNFKWNWNEIIKFLVINC